MDEETKMNVLDAVVLAHLESRRMPATIHSPARRNGDRSAATTDPDVAAAAQTVAEEEVAEVARQTALVATLGRLDATADAAAAAPVAHMSGNDLAGLVD
jgi:hypothetical protein